MIPIIKILAEKKLMGKRIRTSLLENRTPELWRSFMPRRKEIKNNINTELFSIQVYDQSFDFKDFNPDTPFDKWAAVEVEDIEVVPYDMEIFILVGGVYAVFIHKGSNTDNKTFEYIFSTWLPNSEYVVDNRPHFEILGEKYKNNDPTSEEEIWIPIKKKA
jgi:AraC family transcriptional regulator